MLKLPQQEWLKLYPKSTQKWLKNQPIWHDHDMFIAICVGAFLGFLVGTIV